MEYPVIYIKFFIKYNEDKIKEKYEPATLVLASDNKFYILIDGAFYSLDANKNESIDMVIKYIEGKKIKFDK